MGAKAVATEVRFKRFYVEGGPDECWLWTGEVNRGGYGTFKTTIPRQTSNLGAHRVSSRAHRVAYTLANGPIPDGLHVCHTCDVRRCVNPRHLFVGNHRDNMADRDAKLRQCRGVDNGRSKLTEEQVHQIRQSTLSQRATGKQFGVSRTMVYYIKARRNWAHI